MTKMLLEKQVDFNVVNTLEDWSDIEVLLITSGGILEEDIPRIQSFINNGGKVLAMGEGIILNGTPVIDIGAEYLGKANYDVDYTIVKEPVAANLVASPFKNYTPAIRIKPVKDVEILATIREPYFSRTIEHYCSHDNTPYKLYEAGHPAVIKYGNIIYMAHDLDRQYYKEGARLHRDLFFNVLSLLRTHPVIVTEMPSMGRINILKQPEYSRYVVHLLYASPIQRGSVRVIEDIVPLYNIPLTVDVKEDIKKAYLIPSGEKIKTIKKDGKVHLTVPELKCHIAVVLEY
jgi:hypothetical protein